MTTLLCLEGLPSEITGDQEPTSWGLNTVKDCLENFRSEALLMQHCYRREVAGEGHVGAHEHAILSAARNYLQYREEN